MAPGVWGEEQEDWGSAVVWKAIPENVPPWYGGLVYPSL